MSRLPISYLSKFLNHQITDDELIRKGCMQLKPLVVKPAEVQQSFNVFVDCGKCPNCRQNRRNDWVSRMCLHSLYFKHCYFITLTYGTFDASLFDEHPYLSMWYETLPVKCDYNVYNEFLPTPSIIVKSHITNFIKRLRLLVSGRLSYVYSAEYGTDFGRPHYHLIIWCDDVISSDMVRSSWSIKCVNTSNPRIVKRYRGQKFVSGSRFDFVIGFVKFYDLVNNGTLDFDGVRNGKFNARYCFNYVATYLTKFDSDQLPFVARKKLNAVYDTLPKSDKYIDDDSEYSKNHKFLIYNNLVYEDITRAEFLRLVSPCFNFSRLYSIGKQYFIDNFQRFKDGIFSLPEFFGKKLSFPSYYFYLLSLERQSYRIEKISFLSCSYIKGDYKVLLSSLESFRDDPSLFLSEALSVKKCSLRYFYTDSAVGNIFNSIIYFDFERYHISYSVTFDVFEFYKYDNHEKRYIFQFYEERVDFLDFIINRIKKCVKDFNPSLFDNKYKLDSIRCDLISKNPMIVEDFYNKFYYRQSFYNVKHLSRDYQ